MGVSWRWRTVLQDDESRVESLQKRRMRFECDQTQRFARNTAACQRQIYVRSSRAWPRRQSGKRNQSMIDTLAARRNSFHLAKMSENRLRRSGRSFPVAAVRQPVVTVCGKTALRGACLQYHYYLAQWKNITYKATCIVDKDREFENFFGLASPTGDISFQLPEWRRGLAT